MKSMDGSTKRLGKTPAGGDYSEIIFFDREGKVVDEEQAVRCIIRECKADGTLVRETWGTVNN